MTEQSEQSLRHRLASEIGGCLASDLVAHAQRGAVLFVKAPLDLLQAGLAIAEDRVKDVEQWVAGGALVLVTKEQMDEFQEHPQRPFASLIVRPYVLVQEIPDSSS